MKAILKKVPTVDFFIGFFGGPVIPTKQDKFKPIIADSVVITKGDVTEPLDKGLDFYVKKKENNSHKEFEDGFRSQIVKELKEEHPYKLKQKLEVIISVSMTEKRLREVDIDNLTKSILDCFNGAVYEDDSQVINVLASKNVNEVAALNGLMVGIRKIDSINDSWFKNIKLAYFEYEE